VALCAVLRTVLKFQSAAVGKKCRVGRQKLFWFRCGVAFGSAAVVSGCEPANNHIGTERLILAPFEVGAF